MNRGTFRGSPPATGDYTGLPNGGSWAGNRGRLHVDELRLFGVNDGQRNWLANAGAQRAMTTSFLSTGEGNLFVPGDVGMVVNALSGTVVCNGITAPFQSIYNTAGRIRHLKTSNAQYAALEVNTIIDNQPGIAVTGLPNLLGVVSVAFYVANGAACTMGVNPGLDIVSQPIYGTSGGGTLTSTTHRGFTSFINVQAGATLTTRVGYNFSEVNTQAFPITGIMAGGNGVVTNQVAIDVPALSFASNNVGVQLISTAATYTAVQGTAGSIQNPILINANATGGVVSTLNFASASFGYLIHIGGTFALQQSAAALSMGACLRYDATIKNVNAATVNLGVSAAMAYAPTFQADGATLTGSTMIGFNSGVTTAVINAGTLSGLTLTSFAHSPHTIGASTTVATLTGLQIQDSTNNGTITLQVGVDISALVNATTNIGVRLGAMTNPLQFGMSTNGPTTGNLASNGNMVMTCYHGATNYYWLVAWNDAGTVRYKYLQLNGTGVTWVAGTALPT